MRPVGVGEPVSFTICAGRHDGGFRTGGNRGDGHRGGRQATRTGPTRTSRLYICAGGSPGCGPLLAKLGEQPGHRGAQGRGGEKFFGA